MVMQAKFAGKCRKCGQVIAIGDGIEWEKGKGAAHVSCPEKKASVPETDAAFKLYGGSGYGCDGWAVGQTLKSSQTHRDKGWPEFVTVVKAQSQYFREDGLSFGVGDDRGYTYSASCREATPEETAPVAERIAKKEAKIQAHASVDAIAKAIRDTGEMPAGKNSPEGTRVIDTQTLYGGGSWFIVGPEHIWYCRNNGADGDDWSHNNVLTGGAGAIGWRISYDADKAKQLMDAETIIKG